MAENTKARRICFWAVLCAGVLARVLLLGRVPGGLNQDEAFAGYEAFSLLNYGVDSAGYPWPVYLIAWGSGMNALESYLMLPFMALFGPKAWVLRLPQCLVGCASLPVLYLTMRRVRDERTALWAMLLLAICPWHVMMSRWGLESNLAPGFLLFGLYFFLRGLESSRFLMLSALMYGLSLYAYATLWPIVPALLLVQLCYAAAHRRLRLDRYLIIAGSILLLLAAPLVLFLCVNYGWMEEIRTPVLSVPRLVVMRASEMSFLNVPRNAQALARLLLRQTDGNLWNTPEWFGLLYPLTVPFFFLGLGGSLRRLIRRPRAFRPGEAFLLAQLIAGLALGLLVYPNANRVNLLLVPVLVYAAMGAAWFCGLVRWYAPAVLAAYLLLFGAFQVYYYTDYREEISLSFDEGLDGALTAAADAATVIRLEWWIAYPKVLFCLREPTPRYVNTVHYTNWPSAYLGVLSFDHCFFGYDPENLDPTAAYVLYYITDTAPWEAAGFRIERYGWFLAALPQ